MTAKQLMKKLLELDSLDDQLFVRIVSRNREGNVTHACTVPMGDIAFIYSSEGTAVRIEESDITRIGYKPA